MGHAPMSGTGRPFTPLTMIFGFVLVVGGILAFFNPDSTPGDIGGFQYVAFVAIICGGALILTASSVESLVW